MLRGAQPDIIAARFGKLDAEGDFVQHAEPIGREQLARAFHAGMTAMGDDAARARAEAMTYAMRAIRHQGMGGSASEPKRPSDIEPVGACRALKGDAGYACPLLVEWDNPMRAMLQFGGTQMLRGEFTFERNPANAAQPWRVSPAFADEFRQARMDAAAAATDK